MPTYVYRCWDCCKDIEVIQRFNDDPLAICPHCGGTLRRLMFAPAIIFKGSGWYCTDHHKGAPGNGSSAKGKAAAPKDSVTKEPADHEPAAGKTTSAADE